jgi:D-cysteine desulfhydrase family pyridoxal phosphate-dependent enzyme
VDAVLAPWPRASLAHLPTPLEKLPRLSARYPGHELWLKRDDCTGLAMGGNKTRQLEYYFGDALSRGCDTVLSTGAVQSNYMRTIAAAAAKLGMECHIQLESRVQNDSVDYRESGNVFLDRLFGAHIHRFPSGEDEFAADRAIRALADALREAGRKPYVVPLAPVDKPRGALGYVAAAAELLRQWEAGESPPDLLVVGSGSGLTHAGLLVGLRIAGCDVRVLGACVRRDAGQQRQRILEHCGKLESMLGVESCVLPDDVLVEDCALAPGYGRASTEVMRAMADMARLEGILLDPVYSAKTVSTTLQGLSRGSLGAAARITMLHTGGTPALFAYREEILAAESFSI